MSVVSDIHLTNGLNNVRERKISQVSVTKSLNIQKQSKQIFEDKTLKHQQNRKIILRTEHTTNMD